MVQTTKTKDAQQNNLRALYHDRNVCSPSWKVSIIRPRAGLGKSNRDLCQLNSHFPPPVIKINQAETEHFSSVIFVKTGDMTKWCQEHLSHSEESTFYKWLSFSHNNYLNLNKRMEDLTGWPLSAIILSFRAQLHARKMCNPVFHAADVSTTLLSQVHEVKSRIQ